MFIHCSRSKTWGIKDADVSNNYMDVSENSGTPKSSSLIGFSTINHPFWGTIIFGNILYNFPRQDEDGFQALHIAAASCHVEALAKKNCTRFGRGSTWGQVKNWFGCRSLCPDSCRERLNVGKTCKTLAKIGDLKWMCFQEDVFFLKEAFNSRCK